MQHLLGLARVAQPDDVECDEDGPELHEMQSITPKILANKLNVNRSKTACLKVRKTGSGSEEEKGQTKAKIKGKVKVNDYDSKQAHVTNI